MKPSTAWSEKARMKKASREFVISRSWDTVFEKVYDAYSETMKIVAKKRLETPIYATK